MRRSMTGFAVFALAAAGFSDVRCGAGRHAAPARWRARRCASRSSRSAAWFASAGTGTWSSIGSPATPSCRGHAVGAAWATAINTTRSFATFGALLWRRGGRRPTGVCRDSLSLSCPRCSSRVSSHCPKSRMPAVAVALRRWSLWWRSLGGGHFGGGHFGGFHGFRGVHFGGFRGFHFGGRRFVVHRFGGFHRYHGMDFVASTTDIRFIGITAFTGTGSIRTSITAAAGAGFTPGTAGGT